MNNISSIWKTTLSIITVSKIDTNDFSTIGDMLGGPGGVSEICNASPIPYPMLLGGQVSILSSPIFDHHQVSYSWETVGLVG